MKTVYTRIAVLSLVVLGATACSVLPEVQSRTDATFGLSVRQAMAAQVANPAAGRGEGAPNRVDAQVAISALTRYRESFKSPPPTFSVINVGGQ